jgi:hypothetical protein
MLKKIINTILFLSLPMISSADEIKLKLDAPQVYVVKKGDTLWDISGVFLKQPWLWPKLWRLNASIENPHLIYPGDRLRLIYDQQGQPMLVKGKPELKWSPKVRIQLKQQSPISILPLEVIAAHLRYDSVFSAEQLELLPYVVGSEEWVKSNVDGVNLYVHGDLKSGERYALYQKGEAIIDPDDQTVLGYEVKLTGTAKAIRAGDMAVNKPATLYVENVKREIHAGNYVVPVNENDLLPSYFTLQAVNSSIQGAIIKSAQGLREFGTFEVIMINRGQQHSVSPGDVMSVTRKSPDVVASSNGPIYSLDAPWWDRIFSDNEIDYDMPHETLGKIMIFKVYQKMSMALVLTSKKAIRIQDKVVTP